MSFDSISNSSIPAASNAMYLAKEKLVKDDESANLKQGKLDVCDQQWLTQVKNEGCEEEASGGGEMNVPPMHSRKGRDQATTALEVTNDLDSSLNKESNCSGTNFSGGSSGTSYSFKFGEVDDDGGLDDWEAIADALATTDDNKDQNDHKIESLVENVTQLDHLPEAVTQPTASMGVSKRRPEKRDQELNSGVENKTVTKLDHLPEVVNQQTATVDFWKPKPENSQAWRRSDALHSKPKPENSQALKRSNAVCSKTKPENGQTWRGRYSFHSKPKPENSQAWRRSDDFHWKPKPYTRDQKYKSLAEDKNVTQLDHLPEVVNQQTAPVDVWKPKPENGQAWRRGDACHLNTLPNPQKKHNYPMKANRQDHHGGTTLGCKNFVWPPSSCPICCEDLDSTDSSFLPCSCGFQLCLFCHKRILEDDGRCPGCRKHYEDNAVKGEENSDLNGACATTLRLVA